MCRPTCPSIRTPTRPGAPGCLPKLRLGRGSCTECRSERNCRAHWQYLLSNQATRVNLQCPGCTTLWSTDTRHR